MRLYLTNKQAPNQDDPCIAYYTRTLHTTPKKVTFCNTIKKDVVLHFTETSLRFNINLLTGYTLVFVYIRSTDHYSFLFPFLNLLFFFFLPFILSPLFFLINKMSNYTSLYTPIDQVPSIVHSLRNTFNTGSV